jgi:hypothetical protein
MEFLLFNEDNLKPSKGVKNHHYSDRVSSLQYLPKVLTSGFDTFRPSPAMSLTTVFRGEPVVDFLQRHGQV